MADITTDDCKKKLVELYPATQLKSWKRMSKSLNAKRDIERVFECTLPGQARTVVLVERAGQLFEAGVIVVQPAVSVVRAGLHALPSGLMVLGTTSDMNRLLFGASGAEKLSLPFVSPHVQETQFLLVLQNTIDWNAPEKSRSSYDFARSIDFKNFVARCTVQGIDLTGSYLAYIAHQLDHLTGMDEDNFVDISANDYDDSIVDVMDVFERIQQAFLDNNWDAPLARDLCGNIVKSVQALWVIGVETYGEDDEDAQEAFDSLTKVLKFLSSSL